MFDPRRLCPAAAVMLICLTVATPLAAQNAPEMTAEEMTRAFETQKTRGLTLIPAPGAEPAPAAGGTTVSGTAPAPSVTAATPAPASPVPAATTASNPPDAATSTPAPAQVAYQAVAPQDQVNLQIGFAFDSAVIEDDQKARLTTMCQVMKSVDVQMFQIIGHTDASGAAAYNENLSLLRAQEVKRLLVSECGIPEDHLQAVGLGEKAPVNAADPLSDDNRRVEFQALS